MNKFLKTLFILIIVLGLAAGIFAEIQIDPGKYSINYSIRNDWGSGATIDVTITNNGSEPIQNWVLSWNFSGNQKVTELWRGEYSQSGKTVFVNSLDYDKVITPNGGKETFGFNISYSGSNQVPSSYVLKGDASGNGGTDPFGYLRLDQNGNLGIGVENALAKLHVNSETDNRTAIYAIAINATAISAFNKSTEYPTVTISNQSGVSSEALRVFGHSTFAGSINILTNNDMASLSFSDNSSSMTIGRYGDSIQITHGTSNGLGTWFVLKDGKLGLGGRKDPKEVLDVAGNIQATGVVKCGSSRTLKKDIQTLSEYDAFAALKELKPVKFHYKADTDGDYKLGFIAEDVPELVAEKDRKSLSAMDIATLAITVIQKQQKEIDMLKEEIEKLRKNNF